jgi:hypothetical protein
MALVRSVEQQYLNLAQAHAALRSSERACKMMQEALAREQSEVFLHCNGALADAAEAAERWQNTNLNVVKCL